MPEKAWDVVLNDFGDRLFVRFVAEHGTIVDYAGRYGAIIEGVLMQVVL